ncbi:MAG: translation initiation factor [Chitinophagaceae bacterium]|nr:translation initiation factor [Chitinophagaceae bacterium]MDP1810627.1 translation initiation factor [Sediminibacterium sp.]MDP3128591.1 translation initiation factor [Sediminibacterium sp.]
MRKKNKPDLSGFVFSTDPSFQFEAADQPEPETISAAHQKLRIRLDTKQRAGKAVTLVTGFTGKRDDLAILGKQLKNFCGTGGSVKDGEIMIQGDQRDKVLQWLLKNGYRDTKRI